MKERKELHIRMGERIRTARKMADLSQQELSEMIDISPQFLSDIERGLVGMSIESFAKLCDVLNVSGDYLLARTNTPDNDVELDPMEIIANLRFLKSNERKLMYTVIKAMGEAFEIRQTKE